MNEKIVVKKFFIQVFFFFIKVNLFASTFAMAGSYNDYSSISCPSEKEFGESVAALNFSNVPNGQICDSSKRAKLAKILKIANDLSVVVPKTWKGGADEALQNPLSYINRMTDLIDVDLSQTESIAYNRLGSMYLGSIFFNDSPLESLRTLVHEARHSDPNDPGHIQCYQGDIPYSDSGCDQWFATDKKAGSYAYQVSFAYGLARFSDKLTESDKKFLIDDALSTVGTRFNRVPSFLSTPHEILIVLDEQGKIFEVDPFVGDLIPRQAWVENKKVSRLEFNYRTNGIWAWTQDGYVYNFDESKGKGILFGKNLDNKVPIQVIDINHMSTGPSSSQYFINNEHELRYNYYDSESGAYLSKKSSFQPSDFAPARIVLSADADHRFILDDQGVLHQMTDSSFTLSDFQPQYGRKWQQVYRSFLFQDVFGLDRFGTLFLYENANRMVESSFQPNEYPIKIFEGTTIRAFLYSENALDFQYVDEKDKVLHRYTINSASKIVDAAFMRRYSMASTFRQQRVSAEFVKKCNIKKPLLNPWSGRGMGLNKSGSLIFEGVDSNNQCKKYPYFDNINDLLVASRDSEGNKVISYSSTSIVLSIGKDKIEIRPYLQELFSKKN